MRILSEAFQDNMFTNSASPDPGQLPTKVMDLSSVVHPIEGTASNTTCGTCWSSTTSPNNDTWQADSLKLEPFYIDIGKFTQPISGYATPFLVLITIFTNTLVCIVLFKKHMRSPTNTLLMAMSISDMLTGVWPIPLFIYFYTLGNGIDPVPYRWCFLHLCLTEYIPTIFHTASIWLTMALAIQRYIYVCHSMKAKQWCTINNVLKVVVGMYIMAVLTHICRFLEIDYTPVIVHSVLRPSQTFVACAIPYVRFVEIHANIYFNLYFWFRVIFIHFVPCTSLVVLNALLIHAMRSAQARRKQLLMQNRKSESKKLKDSNCTTLMLIAVVGVFLLVELPSGIFFIMFIIENTLEVKLMVDGTQGIASLFINLFILLSYPFNFFIYCGMSRQFRETFKRLFFSSAVPIDRQHSQYMSLATENGAKTIATNETAMVNYTDNPIQAFNKAPQRTP